jgi:hypothetical protein
MNWLQLQNKLFTTARRHPPGDEVPYAFEQRIMARLRTASPTEDWAAWARALWYGAGACATVALLMSIWTYTPLNGNSDPTDSFAADLERSILASSGDPDGNSW